jgi:Ulp1 family protease
VWDPLRGDPRFKKIVASLAPKKSKTQSGYSVKRSHARPENEVLEIIANELNKARCHFDCVLTSAGCVHLIEN